MIELHICNRAGATLRSFALGDNVEVLVGRDETCDIQIAARSVSREHCAIESQGEEIFVRDLGSSSGTIVGGAPVSSVRVEDGLQVLVGPAVLKFYDSGE